MPSFVFQGELIIEDKNGAILEAKIEKDNLKVQCDESKIAKEAPETPLYKKKSAKNEWQEQKFGLTLNKGIFDMEIKHISETFMVPEQKTHCVWQS